MAVAFSSTTLYLYVFLQHHSHIITVIQPHTVLQGTHAPADSINLGGQLAIRGTAGPTFHSAIQGRCDPSCSLVGRLRGPPCNAVADGGLPCLLGGHS